MAHYLSRSLSGLETAVELANDTRFGLSAGLVSTDDSEWDYFVDHIRAGIVNRNRQLTGASGDAPFESAIIWKLAPPALFIGLLCLPYGFDGRGETPYYPKH